LQAKLMVGAVGDQHEEDADRTAEQVMGMPAPSADQVVQRKCELCEEAEKEKKEEGSPVQRKAAAAGGATSGEAPASVPEVLRSSGARLDMEARAFMEPRFGRSFGEVRVHTDEAAARSAAEIGAAAYTVGAHIGFGAGRYAPATDAGRRLLARELTHVEQQ